MVKHIRILAPAKLNLFLHVLGKREDGYHDLLSLLVPITLFDELEIHIRNNPSSEIELLVDSAEPIPEGAENLVFKAAKGLMALTKHSYKVQIVLSKKIPVAAGLGGGSTDAAATLLALNRLLAEPLPWKDLYSVARSLGADVAPLLLRRPCLVTGIGDIFTPVSITPMWFVVICPDVQVSTSWAYGNLKRELTRPCIPYINGQVLKDLRALVDSLKNDLEPVTAETHPEIQQIKEILIEVGSMGALMSGSGAAVFGVFDREPEEWILPYLKSKGYRRAYKTTILREIDWGVVKR